MTDLKIEKLRTSNWEGAFRGMRNPLESWARSDSRFATMADYRKCDPETSLWVEPDNRLETVNHDGLIGIGSEDMKLAMKLVIGGQPHRKFARQIHISCDIIAPWYFWKEYETYQVGTVENSTSQMFKMGSRVLDEGDFIFDIMRETIDHQSEHAKDLNCARAETAELFLMVNRKIERWRKHKDKGKHGNIFWRDLIQCIPGSYIYRRTCTLNYEVLSAMYYWRKKHKLIEWREFCQFMVENLPYPQLFTGKETEVADA